MSQLLTNEKPLVVLPWLAKKIGLNEAIFIQELFYLQSHSKHVHDGHNWVYRSYEDWNGQFPFWSQSTVRRIVARLEKNNCIFSGNFNPNKNDKTKWYRVNDEILGILIEGCPVRKNQLRKNYRLEQAPSYQEQEVGEERAPVEKYQITKL